MICPQRFDDDNAVGTGAAIAVYCEPRKNSCGVVKAVADDKVAFPDQFMSGGSTAASTAFTGTRFKSPDVPPNGTSWLYPWKMPRRVPAVSPMLAGITPANPGSAASSAGST